MEPVQTVLIKGNQNNVPSFFGYKKVVWQKEGSLIHASFTSCDIHQTREAVFEIAPCDSELNDRITTSFLNGVQSAVLRY